MPARKGFTLVEMLVVLIILGILASIAIPSFLAYMPQSVVKATQNNLIAIYDAEKYHYLNNGNYCLNINGCDNLTNINTNLSLNIIDSYFTYACTNDPSGFSCKATSTSNASYYLIVTNTPIILPN